MVNDAASLLSDLRVKQNDQVLNIRDLLEMSQNCAKTTGTSEYLFLDTEDATAIKGDTFEHWKACNKGFLARRKLNTNAA